MEYISAKEAAALWGVDASRVGKLARDGRIEGAKLLGKSWLIPRNAKKPADGRIKGAQAVGNADVFRFPFFMNRSADSFVPPLSREETELRSAELLFLECRFAEAWKKLDRLLKAGRDPYVKAGALFFLCYLSAGYYSGQDFGLYYARLSLAVSEELAYKREIELLRPFLLCLLALFKNALQTSQIDVTYDYSPTAYPVMSIVSIFNEASFRHAEALDGMVYICDTISRQLEHDGHFYEAQVWHILLAARYCASLRREEMMFHLKKAIRIAYEHHFIYPVADIYMYYSDTIEPVLQEYPKAFGEKIRDIGKQIHRSFAGFTERYGITELYTLLSEKDYQFIRFAVLGYSGEEIAKALHVSPRTVAIHYAEIYEKLRVKGKRELAALFAESTSVSETDISGATPR